MRYFFAAFVAATTFVLSRIAVYSHVWEIVLALACSEFFFGNLVFEEEDLVAAAIDGNLAASGASAVRDAVTDVGIKNAAATVQFLCCWSDVYSAFLYR